MRHRAPVRTFVEPVSRTEQAMLRRLVSEHKAAERRHRFPAVLHLGGPGRPEAGRLDESTDNFDHALRCEVLSALLRRPVVVPAMAWLTRPGSLEIQDIDLAWLRAVATVNAETERCLPYVVVTRAGWRDPRSAVGRTWARLRQR